jgi:hypothetical protein
VSYPSGPVHADTVIGVIDTVRLKPRDVEEKESERVRERMRKKGVERE